VATGAQSADFSRIFGLESPTKGGTLNTGILGPNLWSFTPGWRWWFLCSSIYRPFFQLSHCFGHRAFKLRIAARDHVFGPVLDIDVGTDAFILHGPFIIATEKTAARRDHRSTVDK
jgi:hypothetical protein